MPLVSVPFAALLSLGCATEPVARENPAQPEPSSASSGGGAPGTGGNGGGGGDGGSGGSGGGGTGEEPIGGDRPVEVYVPPSYQKGTPAPLLILLHGYSAYGAIQSAYFNLKPLMDTHGMLYAYPDGTTNADGQRFWNATDACCDFEPSGVDDVGYLKGVVDQIKARYDVDPKRVYFVGHSNGGFMSHRMACEHADMLAAIVSLAGTTFDDTSRCTPAEPVSVLQIHGTQDGTISYERGPVYGRIQPGAVATAAAWATFNGCDATPSPGAPLDLDTALEGAETSVQNYSGCAPGGDVALWTIEGGAHLPSLSSNFGPSVVDFLLKHPKP